MRERESSLPPNLPEQEPTMTPDEFLNYVEEHETLPFADKDALKRLNEEMSQEQILEYYYTVNTVDDEQKRQELLDQWIPRPKVLYHATKSKNVSKFDPREETKRHPDDPPQVFGATTEALASVFLTPGDDTDTKSGFYDGGKIPTIVIRDIEAFKAQDQGGYIYTLPPDSFTVDPNVGLGLNEWTSKKPVKPIGFPRFYPSSLRAMFDLGVQIYVAGEEKFERIRRANDDLEVLATLKPVTDPSELE